MDERILITGGRGFVGTRLSAALRYRHPGWPISAPAMVVEQDQAHLDVTDTANICRFIEAFEPTAIVHLAAIAAVTDAAKAPRRSWDVNLGGTLNLTEVMRRVSPRCRLLYVSSAEVYGRSLFSAGLHDESMLLQPTNAYAAGKAAADIHVRQQAFEGLPAVVARPFNHIGPGQSDRFAIPSFASQISAIERGEHPPVLNVGSLDDERDFLDVEDVVDAYVRILEKPELISGLTLNIASGKSRRIGDLLEILLSHAQVAIKVQQDPARLRPEGVTRVVGDAGFARQVLGWEPIRDIGETLLSMLQFERR